MKRRSGKYKIVLRHLDNHVIDVTFIVTDHQKILYTSLYLLTYLHKVTYIHTLTDSVCGTVVPSLGNFIKLVFFFFEKEVSTCGHKTTHFIFKRV